MKRVLLFTVLLLVMFSCDKENNQSKVIQKSEDKYLSLSSVASVFAELPLEVEQVTEVHDAVKSSSTNGYDEEYPMLNIFDSPGLGVGEQKTKSTKVYKNSLSKMLLNHLKTKSLTKSSGEDIDVETYIKALKSSDIQVYWPYSEDWDGETLPIITFDPESRINSNTGYVMKTNTDGTRYIEKIEVTEEIARQRPVWVINRNDDREYTSLEMLRRKDPSWGKNSGGVVLVKPKTKSAKEEDDVKTLIMKSIIVNRNFDNWFAGASEFFVKCGSLENFKASTEAELRLYNPSITDFMIVVKRNQIKTPIPFEAVLVSEWTDQLSNCAFMITEDDGGTQKDWKCSATIKVKSKSYGFDMSIPLNSRDDIVWRGNLSRRYLEKNNKIIGNFGDVRIIFEIR